MTWVSFDNVSLAAEHQEPAEVLFWLGDTRSPFTGSKSVASVADSGVLVVGSGIACDSSLFSLEIVISTKLLTSEGEGTNTSVSLINQVVLVGQHHKAFGLQGRVVDVAHVGQAHLCHASHIAE